MDEPGPSEPGPSTRPSKKSPRPSKVDKATQTSPRYTSQCTPRAEHCPNPPCRGLSCQHPKRPKLPSNFFRKPHHSGDTDPDVTGKPLRPCRVRMSRMPPRWRWVYPSRFQFEMSSEGIQKGNQENFHFLVGLYNPKQTFVSKKQGTKPDKKTSKAFWCTGSLLKASAEHTCLSFKMNKFKILIPFLFFRTSFAERERRV